ncbi:MAG: hypothetical protein OXG53_06345 [Chloroflexi bacterium]|nr:hypothetical protein [Chloroflexota bacterium]
MDSNCSLADAIQAAESDSEIGGCPSGDGADTIHLTGDVTLAAELPQITSDITIEGAGYAISGGDAFRIFQVAGGTLAINDLTLTDGNAERGGAIYNEGTLTINDSSFSNNVAEYAGGAIISDGMLSIADSKFDNNQAKLDGGAIANNSALNISGSSFTNNSTDRHVGGGGAIVNYGELSIVDCSFANNSAGLGGGAIVTREKLTISDCSFFSNLSYSDGGAIRNLFGQLSIADSSFIRNLAEKGGGAIANYGDKDLPHAQLSIAGSTFAGNIAKLTDGGAISNGDYGSLDVTNSSFTNNQASLFGGAVSSFGELSIANSTFSGNLAKRRAGAILVFSAGTPTLAHLTVANNLSKEGGGIVALHKNTALDLHNSLLFGNDGGDCGGQLNQNSGNLIADGSCDPAVSGDPLLGALVESEEGSPAYYPLLPGSPAIDAADSEYCAATDQKGAARPQGDGCDIGAIEFSHE